MKIGLIAPAWDMIRGKKQSRIFLLAPLTFPVLAALTPEDIEVRIIDERLEPVPHDADFDLVGLTFVTAFAPPAYEVADRFRARGVKVVVGGPHASIFPDEALLHSDSVVVGEAEEVWGRLIEDFRADRLKSIYRSEQLPSLDKFPRPRLDLVPEGFTFRNSTMASRGCPFRCDFCFTNAVNQYRQRFRPIFEVVKDIEAMNGNRFQRNHFVFWDDNFTGNISYTKELCRAIAPFGKKWGAAASTSIADDDEILSLLEKSGCIGLFIGLESVNSASLKQAHKYHNRVEKYRTLVKKLHDCGITLTGAFVFGFDQDDPTVFDRTMDLAIKIGLDCITPAILTPLPGTPLYDRMKKEGRIIDDNWAHYDYQHVVFKPENFTPDQLYEGFLRFMNDFFSYASIFRRLGRSRTRLLLGLLANLGYHKFYSRLLQDYEQGKNQGEEREIEG